MRNIILFGPPGSGKGTQAARLVKRFHLQHLSTGELIRAEIQQGSVLGNRLQQMVAGGDLVPDTVVDTLVESMFRETDYSHPGYILDGYPRTPDQAVWLQGLLAASGMYIDFAFELDIPDALLVERVSGRFSCRGCGEGFHDLFSPPPGECCGVGWIRRVEDNEDALRMRLGRYHSVTTKMLQHYRLQPYFHKIDATASMDEVADNIAGIINQGNVE